MSEAFDWNRALNTDSEPAAAKVEPELANNPEPAEPETVPASLEVVEGGADTGLMVLPNIDPDETSTSAPTFEAKSADEMATALEAGPLASAVSALERSADLLPEASEDLPELLSPSPEASADLPELIGPAIETVSQVEPIQIFAPAMDATLLPPAPVHSTLPEFAPDEEPSMSKHYRPAALPDNIYDIPLTTNRFDVGAEIENTDIEVLEDVTPVEDAHLDDILRSAIERKASDVHITVGLPPMARIDGEVAPLPFSILQTADTQRLVYDVLSDESVQKFEQTHELDFGYGVSGLGRFRFNVYMQRGSVAGALRAIPTKIPSFEQLGLPNVIRDISKRSSGLVLVTGPTGSGKSTTIASIIDDINNQRTSHIMTIEDPIEYLHPHKKCMVNQRELHADTYSFHNALRAVLREDPDIILVGELRDLETIEAALTLAETGHLVFGTLHTRNAPSTIDRIVDVFPSDQQDQIRVLLGNTLEGVVSQQLLPRLGGGRSAAIEIMFGTPAVKNLIREGKTHQMYSVIETSSNIGMQTMDSALSVLFRQGYCSYDECMMRAVDKETFARLAQGG